MLQNYLEVGGFLVVFWRVLWFLSCFVCLFVFESANMSKDDPVLSVHMDFKIAFYNILF